MAQIKQHARLIYLLVLLQLVGGPLVVFHAALFGKAAVLAVAEHGWSKGLSVAMAGTEFSDLCQAVAAGQRDERTRQGNLPDKVKNGPTEKVTWQTWDNTPLLGAPPWLMLTQKPPTWRERRCPEWAQAPPEPPPRERA